MFSLLMLTLSDLDEATNTIHVQFRNRTDETVRFCLNGAERQETRLAAGETSDFKLSVYPGSRPTIKIFQPHAPGVFRAFWVEHGGKYAFKYQNRGIDNFPDE